MSDTVPEQDTEVGYKQVRLGPRTITIPETWEKTQLGELGEYLNGYGFKSSNWSDEGRPIIRIQNLTNSAGEETNYYKGEMKYRYIINKGELLVSWSATLGVFIWDGPEGLLNQHIFKVEPSKKVTDDFLYYLLDYNLDLLEMRVQGSTMKHIRKSTFEDTFVPLPSHPEQRRIANILSTVDKQITQTEEIIKKVEELKLGTIQDLLTKGAGQRDTSFVKVPMIPKKWELPNHWDLKFMEDITDLVTDGTHQTPEYVDDGVAFLRVENIKGNDIDWENVEQISESEYKEITAGKVPQRGDVLLSKNGTIGRTQVVDWDKTFGYYVSLCLIRPDTSIVDSQYLSEVLSSEICLQQAKIRSKKATVTNLHLEEIRRFSIPIPPLETQKRIVNILSAIDSVKTNEDERLKSLKQLKRGLMEDLLTGKIRVNTD